MAMLLDRLRAGGPPIAWIDSNDYASALLGSGTVPWRDGAAAIALLRKAQALIKSDVIAMPVGAIAVDWLTAQPGLVQAMGAKERAWFPIKTLLADEALRTHLAELAASLRAVFAGKPLALVLPGPQQWAQAACRYAFAAQVPAVDADDAERAAVYTADFLRIFGEQGVDVLLVDMAGEPVGEAAPAEVLRPIFNVGVHYRWDTGVRTRLPADTQGNAPAPAFAVASVPLDCPTGIELDGGFWDSGTLPALRAGDFHYACIPAAAQPERVLERIAALRGSQD